MSYLNLGDKEAFLGASEFLGGFAHGGFGYFLPFDNADDGTVMNGKIVRLSLLDYSSLVDTDTATPADGVTYLNLMETNTNLKGFFSGFTDGNYAYCVPYRSPEKHGWAARVSLTDFTSSGVEYFNFEDTDPNLKGFAGGFTDSSYAYYVPYQNQMGPTWDKFGLAVRVSLSDFTASGLEYFDMAVANTNLRGFVGGFYHGGYAYYVPFSHSGAQGHVARVSVSNFSPSGVEYFNMAESNSNLRAFHGGFTDGSYAYYVPISYGHVVRVSLSDFSPSGVESFDLTAVESNLVNQVGGFADGSYAYYMPRGNGYIARVSLSDFTKDGVSYVNLADTTNFAELGAGNNFHGTFTDGSFGYGVPMGHGVVPRFTVSPHTLSLDGGHSP